MSKLPLAILLLHLGACGEAVEWAGTRPIGAAALKACPQQGWRDWLAAKLRIKAGEPAARWISAAKTALSGYGYGYGSLAAARPAEWA